MQTLSIPASECQYHDYSQAAVFFKESGCRNTPQLGLLTYYKSSASPSSTIGWYAYELNHCYALPAFSAFDNNGYEHVACTPIGDHEIFFCDNCLYMTISVEGKSAIRRVNVLFDESVIGAFHSLKGLPETEQELCKIYQRGAFLGYYWVGILDEFGSAQYPQLMISPAFNYDEDVIDVHSFSEIEIVEVEIGETIIQNATLWQVIYNERYGITITRLMDFPDNSKDGKYMLN